MHRFLHELLLKEEEKGNQRRRWKRRAEGEPLRSPDGKWDAHIKGWNIYIRPVKDDKPAGEEIALTLDGSENLRYDNWFLSWSPDSRKIATVKVQEIEERRIPLIESAPQSQKQPILQWRDYAKPGDVLIALSTNGNSANCVAAAEVMKAKGGKVVAEYTIGASVAK